MYTATDAGLHPGPALRPLAVPFTCYAPPATPQHLPAGTVSHGRALWTDTCPHRRCPCPSSTNMSPGNSPPRRSHSIDRRHAPQQTAPRLRSRTETPAHIPRPAARLALAQPAAHASIKQHAARHWPRWRRTPHARPLHAPWPRHIKASWHVPSWGHASSVARHRYTYCGVARCCAQTCVGLWCSVAWRYVLRRVVSCRNVARRNALRYAASQCKSLHCNEG